MIKQSIQEDSTLPNGARVKTRKKPRREAADPSVGEHSFPNCYNEILSGTENSGSQSVHRSIRLNKGSGGQIMHLQNIKRIQMEWTMTSRGSHAAQLEKATANEPLNPIAPMKPKPKPRVKAPPAREPDIDTRSCLDLVCKILHFYRSNYS